VRALDLGGSRIVRLLFRLRGMPASSLRLDGMHRIGFRILADVPEREVVLGLIGRFWTPSGGLCRFDPVDFATFREPGWAKAVWGFRMTPIGADRTRLETETRVRCTDDASRRSFRLYWTVIRPFSGLIRRVALRQIRREAEAAHRRSIGEARPAPDSGASG
jgi:hypothetical protein